ncbi:MAG: hypothetical protein IH891_08260 [Planctomycetes bacterium]|nr:hypothetical protein [Planctomycetota bacterium]
MLEAREGDGVQATLHEFMLGWTMDQVLASRAFKYQIPTARQYEEILARASEILATEVGERTESERAFLQFVEKIAKSAATDGVSLVERIAQTDVEDELLSRMRQMQPDPSSQEEQ